MEKCCNKTFQAEQEIEKLLSTGQVKEVSLSLLEVSNNLSLTSDNKFLIESVNDTYEKYLNILPKLEKYLPSFLAVIKEKEIIRNQSLEDVNPLEIDILLKYGAASATDIMLKDKKIGKVYDIDNFCQSHGMMLLGISHSKDVFSGLRNNNTAFVGQMVNDKKKIDYIPIDYKKIQIIVEEVLNIYNERCPKDIVDCYVKPILIHGLIAAFQMFKDGNTRIARIYQNILFWDLINNNNPFRYHEQPNLYVSEALFNSKMRPRYRELIKDLAINPSAKSLNEWIKFNMEIIEKQIYINIDKVSQLKYILDKRV